MQYSSKKYQQYMLHKRSMKLHNEKNHSITDNVLCFQVLKLEKPSINQNIDYAHLRLSLTQIQNHNPQVQTIENKKRTPEKKTKKNKDPHLKTNNFQVFTSLLKSIHQPIS